MTLSERTSDAGMGIYHYDAFGNQFIGDEPDPFGYCEEYYDNESGLVYLGTGIMIA